MKLDLEKIFVALAWPVGLTLVFSSVLALFGVSLDMVLIVGGSMIGVQLLIGLAVDVLKWAGVVNDGTAGKWSAAFNLVAIGFISIVLGLNPLFDFAKLDAQLIDIAKFLTLIFGYVVQIAGAKRVHQFFAYGLGLKAFRSSSA